jgi:putative DNA methylase
VVDAGILASRGGKVRLLPREELAADWNPGTDRRFTIWECTQHLIRRLESRGDTGAAELLAEIQQAKGGEASEVARELSYRLYSTCERKQWAAEARCYNGLVVSWPEIAKLARAMKDRGPQPQQRELDL